VGADDPTLAELLERWIEHLAGLGRSDSTLHNYRKYIDREVVPALGSNRLPKLSPLDIDRFYTKLRKRGLSSSTIRQMHAILRASLNQAERWGLVHRNVAKLASAPSARDASQAFPTQAHDPPSIRREPVTRG
jgi:site-specific recombinase XerC